jgi:NAD(P)-dependent dehydrogenase (short-subunit alcohol dehydrogenase family)
MGKLEGKTALITGGASGIGSASGLLFAREGAKVAIVADKNIEGGKDVVRRITESGGQAIFLQADVTLPADAKRIVEDTVREFGRLDILFNNAGATLTKRLHETTLDDFDKVIGVNLKAVFLVSRFAVEQMLRQGGGVILTNASKAAVVASDCSPVYAASKGGVLQLMQAMAVDYAKDNIRVNSLLPGIIDTPMTDLWIANQPDPCESRRRCEQAQPLKRMGTSEECARAALFLVSDDSNFVTGTYLLVDGGFCAQ